MTALEKLIASYRENSLECDPTEPDQELIDAAIKERSQLLSMASDLLDVCEVIQPEYRLHDYRYLRAKELIARMR